MEQEQKAVLNKQLSRRASWWVVAVIFTGVVGLFLYIGGLPNWSDFGLPTKSPSQSQPTPPPPQKVGVGQEGFLRVSGQSVVLVAISKGALDRFVKASVANDTAGMAELVVEGEAFLVEARTKVLVIDSTIGSRKVRILQGKYVNKTGWVLMEFVVPQ